MHLTITKLLYNTYLPPFNTASIIFEFAHFDTISMRSISTVKCFIFSFFIILSITNGWSQVAGDFRSAGSSNWSLPGTWQRYSSGGAWQSSGTGENSPGQVPGLSGVSGNVTIQNAHTVTLNITNTTPITSLTIGTGATGVLQFETATNRTLTIAGGLSILAGGALNVQNTGIQAGSIVVGGTLSNLGTINLRRSASEYADITLNGTSLTGNGTYTALHDLIIGGSVTNNSTSTINLYEDLTCNNTFNCTAGMISFVGGAGQNINGSVNPTFNNFDVRNGSTSVSVAGTLTSITVNGTLALNTGTANALNLGSTLTSFDVASTFTMTTLSTSFNFGLSVAKTVTIGGNLVTPQIITMTGAGLAHQLKLGGASNGTPATFNTTANSGSIVEYNGSSQNVFASINYRFVKLSGSGTKVFFPTTTINNDLDVTAGGLTVSNANLLNVNGNIDITGGGITTWGGVANTTAVTLNLTVSNNSTLKLGDQAAIKTINVSGNVQVDGGSTMNVGAFAVAHVLSITGNLQVDGTFNMVQTYPGNVCNVTFAGGANTTVTSPAATGTINFNQITMGKNALGNVTDVQTPITMSSPTVAGSNLILTTGTLKLSSASTLTPYYGIATICNTTGGLWLNHASANVSCVGTQTTANPGAPTVSGLLHVTAGNFSYGSGNDVMLINNAASNVWIDGGTFTMYGGVAFSATSQFTMTSGDFKVDPQGFDNLATGVTVVSFASTLAGGVDFNGGALTIINPPFAGAGGTSLFVSPTAGLAYDFSGSTINLGDGVSNKNGIATVGFTIDAGSRYALGDLKLNNGTSTGTNRIARLLNTDCIIGGDLNIGSNSNDNFQINGRLLTLNGTITVGSGTLVGSATSSLAIGGTNTAVMNLPPISSGNLLNLTINKTGTNNIVNLGNTVTLAATGVLTLTSGILEIGNYNLQLLNSNVAGVVGVGGAQTYSVANMIATDGSGYLIGNAVSPVLRVNNPLGSLVSGTYYYSPMTLSAITNGGTYPRSYLADNDPGAVRRTQNGGNEDEIHL